MPPKIQSFTVWSHSCSHAMEIIQVEIVACGRIRIYLKPTACPICFTLRFPIQKEILPSLGAYLWTLSCKLVMIWMRPAPKNITKATLLARPLSSRSSPSSSSLLSNSTNSLPQNYAASHLGTAMMQSQHPQAVGTTPPRNSKLDHIIQVSSEAAPSLCLVTSHFFFTMILISLIALFSPC